MAITKICKNICAPKNYVFYISRMLCKTVKPAKFCSRMYNHQAVNKTDKIEHTSIQFFT